MIHFALFIFFLIMIYIIIINKFFRKCNKISYSFLKKCIDIVSIDNNYMNYGIWYNNTSTLKDANKNLIELVFKKTKLKNKKNKKILDIGCGYGEQDLFFEKHIHKTCNIKAIDISEEQIHYANTHYYSSVNFEVCDATYILDKYKYNKFDIILSIESAFHYPNRYYFFKDVNTLLSPKGKFVITDIMLKNDYNKSIITQSFLYFASDIFNIPNKNLIKESEWNQQLSYLFNVKEIMDITDQTFVPYYKHFVQEYVKKRNINKYIGNMILYILCNHNPFSYKVAVCYKKLLY